MLGRFDEALPLARRAVDLDPLNANSWAFLGETEFFMGQLDEAAGDLKKALQLSPDAWDGPLLLSQIYVMQGRPNDALPEIELVRSDLMRAFLYPIAYHALGRKKESDAALRELSGAGNPTPNAHVVKLVRRRPQTCFDISQALAISELCESHT
jgi:tetratricopeptide (TPR) repeat protein